MKTFQSVTEYEKVAKKGDRIVLGGKGIVDGITSLQYKNDTYKVHGKDNEGLTLRAYKGRTNLCIGANYKDQQILLLSKEKYDSLLTF